MTRIKQIFLCLLFCVVVVITQAQEYSVSEVNRKVQENCERGFHVQAAALLIEASSYFYKQGDTSTAYEMRLKSCHLMDDYPNEFFAIGLTWEDYFVSWYITITEAVMAHKRDEALLYLLKFLRKIEKHLPEKLPYYSVELAYILDDCRDERYRDSIYILQNTLNVIKQLPPTPERVDQYNDISYYFVSNRFSNSLDGLNLKENKIYEIEDWYLRNKQYIHNLDKTLYKTQILEYDLVYVDMLMYYAQTISAQKKEYEESNRLYRKAINVLQPLLELNDTLSQKIAACNAEIGMNYSYLNDYHLCREYSDKAFGTLFNHNDDLDYCDILNILAYNYFLVGQTKLAATLKINEIAIKERIGWNSLKSDWVVYFQYAIIDNPEAILKYKDIALLSEEKYSKIFDYDIFRLVGQAYTLLMDRQSEYQDSAKLYLSYADSLINTGTLKTLDGDINSQLYTLYGAWEQYYLMIGQMEKSFVYSKKAFQAIANSTDYDKMQRLPELYESLACKSSYLHDTVNLHKYLPHFYNRLEEEIVERLPVLGEVESSLYLSSHVISLWHIFELVSWNPDDSLCCGIAYNEALLMKGLLLKYSAYVSQIDNAKGQSTMIHKLNKLHDNIYDIANDNQRWQALQHYQQLERQILFETNKNQPSIHWKDILEGLNENEACIEFVRYYKNGFVWSKGDPILYYAAIILNNGRDNPIFVDLFDEKELIDVYNLQPKSYDMEIGSTLFNRLWGQLLQYIDGKDKVFFSPMGLLNLINIELLADSTGLTALQRFNLYRVSSTKNVLFPSNEQKPAYAVSFGDINYDNTLMVLDSLNTRGNWSYLKNTQYEINRLKELFSENNISITANVGKGATEALFKALDGTNADIIHIASHGYYIPRSQRETIPYFANSESTKYVQDELFYSGLIMSGGQKAWSDSTFSVDRNDGILTAYEISKLDLHNVNLVVLSACETGLGDDLFDGIFGLQRAFKKAGVGSILMSLWKIDDKATSEFMGLFYEKLVKGYSKHEAYTYATHTMKEKYQDANYWASFVLLD